MLEREHAGFGASGRRGGTLGVPRDWFPSAGYDPASEVAWAGPYVGDGVATSNLAGRILRNLITGREERLTRRPSTVAALLGRLTGAH